MELFRGADVSASGMAAERARMEVVANNIANAHSTHSEDGGPYKRQYIVFQEAINDSDLMTSGSLGGVSIVGVEQDLEGFEEVFDPGHPDADAKGNVLMPNVKMANEMIDLITASRAYEANLKALSTFKEMVEQTLSLLRGGR